MILGGGGWVYSLTCNFCYMSADLQCLVEVWAWEIGFGIISL